MAWRPRRRTASTRSFGIRKIARQEVRKAARARGDWELLINQGCQGLINFSGSDESYCLTQPIVLLGQTAAKPDAVINKVLGGLWVRDMADVEKTYTTRFRVASFKYSKPDNDTNFPAWDLFDDEDYTEGPWIHMEEYLSFPQHMYAAHTKWLVHQPPENGNPCDFLNNGSLVSSAEACEPYVSTLVENRPFFIDARKYIPRGTRVKEDQLLCLLISWGCAENNLPAPPIHLYGGIRANITR